MKLIQYLSYPKIPVIILVLLACVISIPLLRAAPTPQKIENDLRELKRAIAQLEREQSALSAKEKSRVNNIWTLKKKIDYQTRLIGAYRRGSAALEDSIQLIQGRIQADEDRLQDRQDHYRARAVHLYQYGRVKEVEVLLDAQTFSQALTRLRYFQILSRYDREFIGEIKRLQDHRQALMARIDDELAEKEKLISSRTVVSRRLKQNRSEEKTHLSDIKKRETLIQASLTRSKERERALLREIQRLNRSRTAGVEPFHAGEVRFADLRHKLPWPVAGKVISGYGLQRHPKYRIASNNLGIDIRAQKEVGVTAVCRGQVRSVMWMPGLGNMVFLDHDDGFITVYAHLSEILVGVGEIVEQGQVFARVGDSGSFEGYKLHFQVWRRDESQNPLIWLSKGGGA